MEDVYSFDAISRKAKMSPRRWAILRFLDRYERENRWLPDIREIGEAVGISSTSQVNFNLNPMRDAGLIDGKVLESGSTAPRTLHVTDLGKELLAWYLEQEGGNNNA